MEETGLRIGCGLPTSPRNAQPPGATPVLSSDPVLLFDRPFIVIHGERLAKALREAIRDETVKTIAKPRLTGNVDMVSDGTDLLEDMTRRRSLMALYD
ncbi:MAG: hypothetical protein QGI49_07375 [SAR202 cluster bacterium]|nr:hypothetical protein [SAR202 cluster bacterium]